MWHTARISRGVCGSVSTERWCFYLDGVFRLGKKPDFISGAIYAGSESVGTTITQNLKIDYRDAKRFDVSAVWHLWSGLRACEDPPYVIDDTAPHTYKVNQ